MIDNGKPLPQPHPYKQAILRSFAKKYKTDILVETGSFLGDVIAATYDLFKKIYSIQISPEYYKKSLERFEGADKVHLLLGDSATKLKNHR